MQVADFKLTEKQEEAVGEITSYLLNHQGYLLLYGFAGTGKTTTISYALKKYISTYGGGIVMTAPTNKAVKVLENTVKLNADYMTVYGLLGLHPVINNRTGDQEFKQKGTPKYKGYDAIIIDEVSMLNQELFDLLVKTGKPIVFIGDYKQLRPVSDDNTVAAPFRKSIRDQFGIKPVGLLEIIRQPKESGIIPFSAHIRKGHYSDKVVEHFVKNSKDIAYGTKKDVLEMFSTYDYQADRDYCKVIAYTNKRVNRWNKVIRNHIYNNPETSIVVGEQLIVNKPLFDGSTVLLTTNDEVQVESYDIAELPYEGTPFKVYSCLFTNGVMANIIHEDSREDYDSYVEALKLMALKTKQPMYWRKMYEFMDCFLDVNYSYAITCHKSQGSTYKNVFICKDDFNICWDEDDRQALWYVGVTRASKKVVFV